MRIAAAVASLGLLALVLAGCQGTPAPSPRAAGAVARDVAELAAAALDAGDYARASELYQKALADSPDRLALHYGLGVASSHLDRRTDTIREFGWVVKNGDPKSAEVGIARRWLRSAGALSEHVTAAASEDEQTRESPRAPSTAVVSGRMTFAEAGGDGTPQIRAQLFLHDYPNRVVYYRIRTDEHGRFIFRDVPPGIYKLTDRAAGMPRWRLRLEVKGGQDLTVDLSPANSTKIRDDFPDAS